MTKEPWEIAVEARRRPLEDHELDYMLKAARRPGLYLAETSGLEEPGTPGCWLDGRPTLPDDIPWPMYFSPEGGGLNMPMQFFAQFDLAHIPRLEGMPLLPLEGTLFFFYEDLLGCTDGFQEGSHKVIFVPYSVIGFPERERPPLPDLSVLDADPLDFWWHSQVPGGPHDQLPDFFEKRQNVTLEPVTTIEEYYFKYQQFSDAAKKMNRMAFLELEKRLSPDDKEPDFDTLPKNILFGNSRSSNRNLISLLATYRFFPGPARFEIAHDALASLSFNKTSIVERGV